MAMNKKETLEAVLALGVTHDIDNEDYTVALTEILAPKKAGGSFNIDDIAVLVDGKPVFILDSVFKVWVPITNHLGEDLFYVKPDSELGYSRFSRAAEKARKDSEKVFKASKDGIFKDLMAGDIDQTAAQSLMETAESARTNLVPTGVFFGFDDKPEADQLDEAHEEFSVLAEAALAEEEEETETEAA